MKIPPDVNPATWQDIARADLDYHLRQFDVPYRSTVALAEFVKQLPILNKGEALDVGCGAGANIHHLARVLPGHRWTGVDIAGDALFSEGRRRLDPTLTVEFIPGDFFILDRVLAGRRFDLVFSLQTLLILPQYEEAVEQLLGVTHRWLIVTSLFTDFKVDARVEVMDYTWPEHHQGPYYYNTYSLDRFKNFCKRNGGRDFVVQDFEIDVDLPISETGGFGTYTRALGDGRRLQFTGPVFQPWKFVAVRVG